MKPSRSFLRSLIPAVISSLLMVDIALAQPGRQRTYDPADEFDYAYEPPGRYERNDPFRYERPESMHAVPYRPSAPYVPPSAAPSARHVWIPAGWQWQHGRYVPVAGYWTLPPHKHLRYIPGYWNRTRYGWVWRPGHWVKKKGRGWWQ